MTDRYTKAVLTVIAGCLVWNVVQSSGLVRPAKADGGPVHVILDQISLNAYDLINPIRVRAVP